jgi:hypothetical protein
MSHYPQPPKPHKMHFIGTLRRIHKIIAVHSKGFTRSASTLAEKYGIDTVVPLEGSTVNWSNQVLPFESFAFQMISCKFPQGLLIRTLGENPPNADPSTSVLIFPDQSEITIDTFVTRIREMIRTHYSQVHDLAGKKYPSEKQNEVRKTVDLFITFPDKTILKPTKGENLAVQSATAVGFVTVKTMLIETLKYISLTDSIRATNADFELMGHKAGITLTEQEGLENELGICVYWEGGTIGNPPPTVSDLPGKIRVYVNERK